MEISVASDGVGPLWFSEFVLQRILFSSYHVVEMYTLLVCADLYGEKMNLELTFSAMPTMGELQRKITEVYNAEAQVKRPQGYPAIDFQIARLQIYDDVLLKWTDLVTCTQLHEYDQLYAFQPQSPWHIDVQKDLPPPRPPTVHSSTGGNTSRSPMPGPATPQSYDRNYGGSPSYGNGYDGRAQHQPNVSAISHSSQHGGYTGDRGKSPTQERLEQQRMREEQLRAELARVHEETSQLEHQWNREREEEQRRQADAEARALQQREAEIQRQRQQLEQAEAEYRRALEQRQLHGGGTPGQSTSRPLY